jgi:hypothetical protein
MSYGFYELGRELIVTSQDQPSNTQDVSIGLRSSCMNAEGKCLEIDLKRLRLKAISLRNGIKFAAFPVDSRRDPQCREFRPHIGMIA